MAGRFKDAARVRIFPPAVPLATILAGWALERVLPLAPGFLPAPFRYLLGAVVLLGALAFGGWAVLTMHRAGQSASPYRPTDAIIADGPFALSRNPMYLAMVLASLGACLALASLWVLLLSIACWWGARADGDQAPRRLISTTSSAARISPTSVGCAAGFRPQTSLRMVASAPPSISHLAPLT